MTIRINLSAGLLLLSLCLLAPFAPAQDTRANEGGDLAFGGPGSDPGQFLEIRDLTFDAKGNLYVLDGIKRDAKTKQAEGNLRVQKFSRDGKVLAIIDLRDEATGEALGDKNDPQRIAADSAGNLYISQPLAGRIQQFGPDGKFVRAHIMSRATALTVCTIDGQERIAVVPSHREVVMGKWNWLDGDRVLILSPAGGVDKTLPLDRAVEDVIDVTADRAGNFYLKGEPNAIYKFSPAGKLLKIFGGNPTSRTEDGSEVLHTVAVDSKGNVYTMAWGNPGQVTRFEADGATVTQRPGQFKWADPWSVHSGYVPLAIDPDDRLWAAATTRWPSTYVHLKKQRAVPAIVRASADYFTNPPGMVRTTPVRVLGFKASVTCGLPYNVSYEAGKPVPMEFVVAPGYRALSTITVSWRAFDAAKTQVGKGQIDLALENGKEARAPFTFTPPRFGAYFVIASINAPQGDVGAVGEHVGVTPHFANVKELAEGESKSGWTDGARQLWTGLPNLRIHPGKDEKGLVGTDEQIAAAEKAGILYIVQLVDNMKHLTPEYVRQVVTRYKGRVKYYEICNEPNFSSKVDEYFAGHKMAHAIIKEVDLAALVMGPATVNISLDWQRRLYELGFKDLTDIISTHDYEGHESITPEHWTWKFAELRKIMAAHGDQAKPIWQTERAIAGVRGDNFQGLVQAIRCTLHRDLLETLGIPAEHNFHYYLNQGGYSSVPSYVWSNAGPQPAALALRTRHALTAALGHTYTGTLDFGTSGNSFLQGLSFVGKDGSTVVLRNLGSRAIPVEFSVKGTDTLDVVDAWGNAQTVKADGGRVRLSLTQLPTYVKLAPGQEIAPSKMDFGRNIAADGKWQYSGTTKSDAALLTNGILETYHDANPNGGTNGAKIWTGDLPLADDGKINPQTLVATFEKPQPVHAVIVRGVRADNNFCALLDYDLEWFDGQKWTTIEAVHNAMPASERVASPDAKFATWMDDTNLYVHQFAPVQARGLRIIARQVSRGFLADQSTRAWGNLIPPKLMLREVEIYTDAAK